MKVSQNICHKRLNFTRRVIDLMKAKDATSINETVKIFPCNGRAENLGFSAETVKRYLKNNFKWKKCDKGN